MSCDDGGRWLQVDCASGSACDSDLGRCDALLCEPGETFCDDPGGYRVCSDDGRSLSDVVVCSGGSICHAGGCRTCVPGAVTCLSEGEIGRCAPDGGSWQLETLCGSGTTCHEGTGGCVSSACSALATCDTPTTFKTCEGPAPSGVGGTWSQGSHPCPLGSLCVDGRCADCTDGPARCAGPHALEVCDPEVDGYVEVECPPLSPCSGIPADCRAAEAPFCFAGETDCVDEVSYRTCDAEGSGFEGGTGVCLPGTTCSFGDCVASSCQGPLLLLVDRSTTMESHWQDLMTATWVALEGAPGTRAGAAFFPALDEASPPPLPQLPIGQLNGTSSIVMAFDALRPEGATPLLATLDRLLEAPELFCPESGARVALITDGPLEDVAALTARAHALQAEAGLYLDVIGLTDGAEAEALHTIADSGGGTLHLPLDAQELEAALVEVAAAASGCTAAE